MIICTEKANGEAAHLSVCRLNGVLFYVIGSKNPYLSNQIPLRCSGKNAGFVATIVVCPKHIFKLTALNQTGGFVYFIGLELSVRSPDDFTLRCRTLKDDDKHQDEIWDYFPQFEMLELKFCKASDSNEPNDQLPSLSCGGERQINLTASSHKV